MLANRYRILRALKTGGMGAVYLASGSHLGGRLCAIKEMLDAFPSDDARREGQLWFAREAQLLGRLRHPSIPEIYDYFIEDGRFYLVLEYIEGENLEDRLARLGTPGLPEGPVLEWAAQIAEVLQYLHTQAPPVIFRDLKPANVMVTRDETIRVVDFGIARVFTPVRQATLVGTPGYAPPEQYQGLADPLSDLYALAATVHHLLSGRDPRDAPPFSFQPIRALAPTVSAATGYLLEGALRMEMAERGPRVEEFGRQARRISGELAQGLAPSLRGALAVQAPGDPLPATRVVVPFPGLTFGRLARGAEHTVGFPLSNEGPSELRAVLHSNVKWLIVPEGQLRVPCGSTAQVPLRIDASAMPTGMHRAMIEIDGNGGTMNVPVEARIVGWIANGASALLVITVAGAALLAVLVQILLHYHG